VAVDGFAAIEPVAPADRGEPPHGAQARAGERS
jgi:hypothetical protein